MLAEGRIYFLNETGTATVIKAGPVFQTIATNAIGEPTLASPAVIDGAIFIRSEGHLWRFGK